MKKVLSLLFCLGLLISTCSSVFAMPTKDAQYYYALGNDYARKNNRLGAAEVYKKALQVDPNFDQARIARAQILYFHGKYIEALEEFNYFYCKPGYGAAAFYQERINSKLALGMYEAAMDDMFEVLLAYGGHAKIMFDMHKLAQEHPELSYKLLPASHPDLLAKYSNQARAIRDYAQMYKNEEGKVINEGCYKYLINIARTINPYLILYVDKPTQLGPKVAPNEYTEVTETENEKI